jgi:hypothetical protein
MTAVGKGEIQHHFGLGDVGMVWGAGCSAEGVRGFISGGWRTPAIGLRRLAAGNSFWWVSDHAAHGARLDPPYDLRTAERLDPPYALDMLTPRGGESMPPALRSGLLQSLSCLSTFGEKEDHGQISDFISQCCDEGARR